MKKNNRKKKEIISTLPTAALPRRGRREAVYDPKV